jgi:hypothetical protein
MFIPHKWHNESEPWEKKPASNGLELKVGTALAFSSGNLVKATGTTKPEYICMEDVTTKEAGQMIHVERVRPETEYETELSVASASIKVGVKYTIDTTGTMITATTDSGVAEVTEFDGTAVGDKVRVRFV